MDFTHGTNHLGYHLGSIMPTAATGRGLRRMARTHGNISRRQMSQRNDLIVVMKRIIYSATETDYDT
ncbi:hypothetical protein PC114_g16497, partial [Phytophthora cactorum]